MKTLSLFITLFIVVTSNLGARENPFEPTQTYETEAARLMEIEENYPYEFQEKEDQEEHMVQKDVNETRASTEAKMHITKKQEKMQIKPEPVKKMAVVEPKMKMSEPTITPMVEKMVPIENTKIITLEKAMKTLKEEKIVIDVPERKDIAIDENIDFLPFVNLKYTNNKMQVSSKYEVFRKFTIEESQKIVLDYHAKIPFLTKSQTTNTNYFKKVIVGNHQRDKYFRIVIVLKHSPSKYKVTYTDNLVTVEFDKDMI